MQWRISGDQNDMKRIVLYRYNDLIGYQYLTVVLHRYVAVKETPKGIWVVPEWCEHIEHSHRTYRRWVANETSRSKKRFCYRSKVAAWESYKRRKEAHLDRLRGELELAEKRARAINELPEGFEPPDEELQLAPHGLREYFDY